MAQNVNGHTWHKRPELQPCLLCAVQTEVGNDGGTTACNNAVWVLDYSWGVCGDYRVHSHSSEWHTRQPLEAHLYAPDCSYWERFRTCKQRCAFMLFDWTQPAAPLADVEQRGYGIISDTEGAIGQCIRNAALIGQSLGDRGFWQAQAELCHALALIENVVWDNTNGLLGASQTPALKAWENEVRQLIAKYTHTTLSLDILAAELGVSRSTLSHRYQAATGESPLQSHAQFRLLEARKRLLAGQTVTQVAMELGFGDIYHFSRFFKRWQGVSPREYARSFFRMDTHCTDTVETVISQP